MWASCRYIKSYHGQVSHLLWKSNGSNTINYSRSVSARTLSLFRSNANTHVSTPARKFSLAGNQYPHFPSDPPSKVQVTKNIALEIAPIGNFMKVFVTGPLGTVRFHAGGVTYVNDDKTQTTSSVGSNRVPISKFTSKINTDTSLTPTDNEIIKDTTPLTSEQTSEIQAVNKRLFFGRKADAKTFMANFRNAVHGVQNGYYIRLVLKGVGYRSWVIDNGLYLDLGYNHLLVYRIPPNIVVRSKRGRILIFGCSKQVVGNVAGDIRSLRKPDPYKGKGVLFYNQEVKLKTGKQR